MWTRGDCIVMDAVVTNFPLCPKHFVSVNRALLRSSTRKCAPILVHCEGGGGQFVEGQRQSLKRSEVVDLLLTALNTLLIPENQERLKQRALKFELSRALAVEQGPSEATTEISLEVLTSAPQLGRESPPLKLSTAPTELPDEVHTAANHSSSRVLKAAIEASVEQSSPLPDLVQQVSLAGTLKDTGESVHEYGSSETGVSSQDTDLSTMRRLKTLNVHSYVHSALRESFLRSYLRSRKVEE